MPDYRAVVNLNREPFNLPGACGYTEDYRHFDTKPPFADFCRRPADFEFESTENSSTFRVCAEHAALYRGEHSWCIRGDLRPVAGTA